MQFSATFRRLMPQALAALLLLGGVPLASAQPLFGRRAGFGQHRPQGALRPGHGPNRNREHLAQWMQQHSNMSLADQQRALEKEPGFRGLPPQTQQRMRNRLVQLNNMPPERRRSLLARIEDMERLSPPQRQQVRSAMHQLGQLPPDRRRMVARAFRNLRDMPPSQQQALLHSENFRGRFSPEEQSTLSNLLSVGPLLPIDHPDPGPVPNR